MNTWDEVEQQPEFGLLTPEDKASLHTDWHQKVLNTLTEEDPEKVDAAGVNRFIATEKARNESLKTGRPFNAEAAADEPFRAEARVKSQKQTLADLDELERAQFAHKDADYLRSVAAMSEVSVPERDESLNREVEAKRQAVTALESRFTPEQLQQAREAKQVLQGERPTAVLGSDLYTDPALVLDKDKYRAAVAASNASPEAKARAIADFSAKRQQVATEALKTFRIAGESPLPGALDFPSWEATQPEDVRKLPPEDKALRYMKTMEGRGDFRKLTSAIGTGLLQGGTDVASQGLGVAAMAANSPALAKQASEVAEGANVLEEAQKLEGDKKATGATTLGGAARLLPPMAAAIGAGAATGGVAALPVSAALSGAQTAGAQFPTTFKALVEQGMSEGEALEASRNAALTSGLITTALTAAFGKTGIEAALLTGAGGKELVKNRLTAALLGAVKGAGYEIPEELLDEAASQVIEQRTIDPNKPVSQIVDEFSKTAPDLAMQIALLGGAGGAIGSVRNTTTTPGATPVPGTTVETPPDNDFARRAAMEGATEFRPNQGTPVQANGITIAHIPEGSPLTPEDVADFADDPDFLKALARKGDIVLPEVVAPLPGVDPAITEELNTNIAASAALAPQTVEALKATQAEGAARNAAVLQEAAARLAGTEKGPDLGFGRQQAPAESSSIPAQEQVASQLGHEGNRKLWTDYLDKVKQWAQRNPEKARLIAENAQDVRVAVVGGTSDSARNHVARGDIDLVFDDNIADPDIRDAVSSLQTGTVGPVHQPMMANLDNNAAAGMADASDTRIDAKQAILDALTDQQVSPVTTETETPSNEANVAGGSQSVQTEPAGGSIPAVTGDTVSTTDIPSTVDEDAVAGMVPDLFDGDLSTGSRKTTPEIEARKTDIARKLEDVLGLPQGWLTPLRWNVSKVFATKDGRFLKISAAPDAESVQRLRDQLDVVKGNPHAVTPDFRLLHSAGIYALLQSNAGIEGNAVGGLSKADQALFNDLKEQNPLSAEGTNNPALRVETDTSLKNMALYVGEDGMVRTRAFDFDGIPEGTSEADIAEARRILADTPLMKGVPLASFSAPVQAKLRASAATPTTQADETPTSSNPVEEEPDRGSAEAGPSRDTKNPDSAGRPEGQVTNNVVVLDPSQLETVPEDLARAKERQKANTPEWQRAAASTEPISVLQLPNGKYRVLDGHPRLLAAIERGEPVQAIVEKPWTPTFNEPAAANINGHPVVGTVGVSQGPAGVTFHYNWNGKPQTAVVPFSRLSRPVTAPSEEVRDSTDHSASNDEVVEANLTAGDKQEAATQLGFNAWGKDTLAAFNKAFADWMVTAKAGTEALGRIFARLLQALKKASMVALAGISVSNTNVSEATSIPYDAATQAPVKQTSENREEGRLPNDKYLMPVPEKRADFGGVRASKAVINTANWVVANGDAKGTPFVVADKRGGLIYVFDVQGTLVHKAPALYGKTVGDIVPEMQPDRPMWSETDKEKVTPSGRFEASMGVAIDEEKLGRTLDFLQGEDSDLAIHRLYLGNEADNRPARLSTRSASDNRISYGCINVSDSVMDSVIDPLFSPEGGVVYILPETSEGARHFPPFVSPANSTPKSESVERPWSPATNEPATFTAANGQKVVGTVSNIAPDGKATVQFVWNGKPQTVVVPAARLSRPVASVAPVPNYEYTQEQNTRKAGKHFPVAPGVYEKFDFQKAFASMAEDTSLSKMYREVARILSKMPGFGNVDLHIVADGRKGYAGEYSHHKGKSAIAVNLRQVARGKVDALGTILHEALHHVTLAKVRNPQGAVETEAAQALDQIRQRVRAYAGVKEKSRQFSYELGTNEEFISALFTHPGFQDFLASIPDDFSPKTGASKFRSLLTEIFRRITELVTGRHVAKGSTMEQSIASILALFETPHRTLDVGPLEKLSAKSEAESAPTVQTAVMFDGKPLVAANGVTHYDLLKNWIKKNLLQPYQRENADEANALADTLLTNDFLREHGVKEGFMVNGEFADRQQALQALRDAGQSVPQATAEGRDWLDSSDLATTPKSEAEPATIDVGGEAEPADGKGKQLYQKRPTAIGSTYATPADITLQEKKTQKETLDAARKVIGEARAENPEEGLRTALNRFRLDTDIPIEVRIAGNGIIAQQADLLALLAESEPKKIVLDEITDEAAKVAGVFASDPEYFKNLKADANLNVDKMAEEAGRALNIFNVFRRLTPEGFLRRMTRKYNDAVREKVGQNFDVPAEKVESEIALLRRLARESTSPERRKAILDAIKAYKQHDIDAKKLIEALFPQAGFRDRMNKGGESLVRDFFQMMAGPRDGKGPLAEFDETIQGALSSMLRKVMEAQGLVAKNVSNQMTDIDKMVRAVSGDELRFDKIAAADEAMQKELAKIEDPERRATLQQAWEEATGKMFTNIASDATVRRAINAELKDANVDWTKVFDTNQKPASIRGKVVDAVMGKIEALLTDSEDPTVRSNLGMLRGEVSAAFDFIADNKRTAWLAQREAVESRRRVAEHRAAFMDALRNQGVAEQALNRISEKLAGPQRGKTDKNPVSALVGEHMKKEVPDFVDKLVDLDVDRATAEKLDKAAATLRAEIAAAEKLKAADRAVKDLMKSLKPKPRAPREKIEKSLRALFTADAVGALDDQAFFDAFGEAFGMPPLSSEQQAKIKKLVREINALPKGPARLDKQQDLDEELGLWKGISARDVLLSAWYANILSGISTQGMGLLGNMLNFVPRSLFNAISNPRSAGAYFKGALSEGLPTGIAEAKAALKGRGLYKVSKYGDKNLIGALELLRKKGPSTLPEWVAYIASAGTRLRYVFRIMQAIDALAWNTAREGHAYLAAHRALLDQEKQSGQKRSSEEFYRDFINNLGGDTAQIEEDLRAARQTLLDAGQTPDLLTVDRMAREARNARRAGASTKGSNRFADRIVLQQDPEGSGKFISSLIDVFQKKGNILGVPLGQLLIPFNKIVSNLFEQSLDYTPVGALRAYLGGHLSDVQSLNWKGQAGFKEGSTQFDPMERRERAMAATAGMTAAAILYAMANAYKDEPDEDVPFMVYGWGPESKTKREQMPKGWVPYSIKTGDKYIKFSEMPFGMMFAAAGSAMDAMRYKNMDKKTSIERLAYILKASAKGFMNQGVMSSLDTAMESMMFQASDKKIADIPVNLLKGMVPAQGMLRDINTMFDSDKVSSDSLTSALLRDIPFAKSYGTKPDLNVFGEPIKMEGYPVVRRIITHREPHAVADYLGRNDLHIPGMEKTIEIGQYLPDQTKKNIQSRAVELGAMENGLLTPEQNYEFKRQAGQLTKAAVETVMAAHPKILSDQERKNVQKVIDTKVENARRRAMLNAVPLK